MRRPLFITMNVNNYFSIGKLATVHGLNGHLVLKHSLGKRSALKGVTTIFLEERKNSFIPYFVQEVKPKDPEHVYIKLEGIDTPEAARKLMPAQVYLTEDDFKQQAASSAPLSLLGYHVVDESHGPLGQVAEVIEMPMQVLVKVMINGKEALLPINEQSLLKTDRKTQTVYLRLPDGLLALYTD